MCKIKDKLFGMNMQHAANVAQPNVPQFQPTLWHRQKKNENCAIKVNGIMSTEMLCRKIGG